MQKLQISACYDTKTWVQTAINVKQLLSKLRNIKLNGKKFTSAIFSNLRPKGQKNKLIMELDEDQWSLQNFIDHQFSEEPVRLYAQLIHQQKFSSPNYKAYLEQQNYIEAFSYIPKQFAGYRDKIVTTESERALNLPNVQQTSKGPRNQEYGQRSTMHQNANQLHKERKAQDTGKYETGHPKSGIMLTSSNQFSYKSPAKPSKNICMQDNHWAMRSQFIAPNKSPVSEENSGIAMSTRDIKTSDIKISQRGSGLSKKVSQPGSQTVQQKHSQEITHNEDYFGGNGHKTKLHTEGGQYRISHKGKEDNVKPLTEVQGQLDKLQPNSIVFRQKEQAQARTRQNNQISPMANTIANIHSEKYHVNSGNRARSHVKILSRRPIQSKNANISYNNGQKQ